MVRILQLKHLVFFFCFHMKLACVFPLHIQSDEKSAQADSCSAWSKACCPKGAMEETKAGAKWRAKRSICHHGDCTLTFPALWCDLFFFNRELI